MFSDKKFLKIYLNVSFLKKNFFFLKKIQTLAICEDIKKKVAVLIYYFTTTITLILVYY